MRERQVTLRFIQSVGYPGSRGELIFKRLTHCFGGGLTVDDDNKLRDSERKYIGIFETEMNRLERTSPLLMQCEACGAYIDTREDSYMTMPVENKAHPDFGKTKYFCGDRSCELPDRIDEYRAQK